ncbi:MAG TPA: hypothetical protein VMD05_01650 [Candidatus Nanoarchaeia archaeon]|nr:hypothetical protein [Candidatus Nanoarchaeia archaeon]
MNREEALATMHEIVNALRESIIVDSVSFDDSQVSKTSVGYEIRMRCTLNPATKAIISPILKKNKLEIKETDELITIYQPRT